MIIQFESLQLECSLHQAIVFMQCKQALKPDQCLDSSGCRHEVVCSLVATVLLRHCDHYCWWVRLHSVWSMSDCADFVRIQAKKFIQRGRKCQTMADIGSRIDRLWRTLCPKLADLTTLFSERPKLTGVIIWNSVKVCLRLQTLNPPKFLKRTIVYEAYLITLTNTLFIVPACILTCIQQLHTYNWCSWPYICLIKTLKLKQNSFRTVGNDELFCGRIILKEDMSGM